MANTKQCPFCKLWIALPIRRADEAFEKHKRECSPEGYARGEAFRRELLGDGPDPMEGVEVWGDAAIVAKDKPASVQEAAKQEEPVGSLTMDLATADLDKPLIGENSRIPRTGMILLDRTRGAGWLAPNTSDRWITLCKRHREVATSKLRSDADKQRFHPETWCAGHIAERGAK